MIARNEEANLPRTLKALVDWVDEIVIVDSGSVDSTPQIAREFGARFSFNVDFRGHAEQKNIAIRQCTGDWVLLLDADEVVPPELALEIQARLAETTDNAFWIPRLNLFLTRWMKHGGLYPDEKLRLFKRGTTSVDEEVGPHGTPYAGGSIGRLKHHITHYGYPDFSQYLEHMNEYSSGTVGPLLRRFKSTSLLFLLVLACVNPVFSFIKNFIFRGGWMDGAEGLVFHLNHAVYVHWKYIKLWDARKRGLAAAVPK